MCGGRGWKGAAGSEERLMGEGEETMFSANGRAQVISLCGMKVSLRFGCELLCAQECGQGGGGGGI
jgi:hypothetical protein